MVCASEVVEGSALPIKLTPEIGIGGSSTGAPENLPVAKGASRGSDDPCSVRMEAAVLIVFIDSTQVVCSADVRGGEMMVGAFRVLELLSNVIEHHFHAQEVSYESMSCLSG